MTGGPDMGANHGSSPRRERRTGEQEKREKREKREPAGSRLCVRLSSWMWEKLRHGLYALALLRSFIDGKNLAEFTGMIELSSLDQLTEQIIASAID